MSVSAKESSGKWTVGDPKLDSESQRGSSNGLQEKYEAHGSHPRGLLMASTSEDSSPPAEILQQLQKVSCSVSVSLSSSPSIPLEKFPNQTQEQTIFQEEELTVSACGDRHNGFINTDIQKDPITLQSEDSVSQPAKSKKKREKSIERQSIYPDISCSPLPTGAPARVAGPRRHRRTKSDTSSNLTTIMERPLSPLESMRVRTSSPDSVLTAIPEHGRCLSPTSAVSVMPIFQPTSPNLETSAILAPLILPPLAPSSEHSNAYSSGSACYTKSRNGSLGSRPRVVNRHRRVKSAGTHQLVALDTESLLISQLQDLHARHGTQHAKLSLTYNVLGNVYFRQQRFEAAIETYRKAIVAAQEKDKVPLADSYSNLGTVYWSTGNVDQAIECLQQGLRLRLQQGNVLAIATIHYQLGLAYTLRGTYDEALHQFISCITERGGKSGQELEIARSYDAMGKVYTLRGNFEEALESYDHAIRLKERRGASTVSTLEEVGRVQHTTGDLQASLSTFQIVFDMLKQEVVDMGLSSSKQAQMSDTRSIISGISKELEELSVGRGHFNK
jgi:tetratricopeptide (TPR) repeat protein